MGASVGAGAGGRTRGVSQLCVRRENEVAALADPFWALFFLPECKCQLRPDTLVYCVKKGKRSLNYLQINCLLPLSVPQGPESVFQKAGSQPPTSPTLRDPFPLTPSQTRAQSHLRLPFLMTNLNALIRKHLRVHSSQTPYGAQYEICSFS